MSECYELTLTQNYVSDWTFCDAVRELIQNGTDQEIIDKTNLFTVDYDPNTEILKLINIKSKLNINTLLLGRSSKSNNADTVGQFGEGYKIAALVLNRLGKTFTIFNNEKNEVWTSRFKNSEKWKERILTFYVEKVSTENTGLVIEIADVTVNEFDELQETWLGFYEKTYEIEKVETSYGEILLNEDLKNKIFINGLSVSCSAEMAFGYNFKPKYLKLERDRKACESWDARNITSLMIAEAISKGELDEDIIKELIAEDEDDVWNLRYNSCNTEVAEIKTMLINEFDKRNTQPFSVPVSTQEEIYRVKAYGGNPVVVSHTAAELLKTDKEQRIKELIESSTNSELTLRERFQRWYDIYAKELSFEAKDELAELINELM